MFKFDNEFQLINDNKYLSVEEILKYMEALESSRDSKLKAESSLLEISLPFVDVKKSSIKTNANVDNLNDE